MTTPPIELAATVERVERKEPPEPEGWIPLYYSEDVGCWYVCGGGVGSIRDSAREAADLMARLTDHKRLIRISPAPSPAETIKAALGRLSAAMGHPCLEFGESGSIEAALIDFAAAKIREVGWPLPEPSPSETGAVPTSALEVAYRACRELRYDVAAQAIADFLATVTR